MNSRLSRVWFWVRGGSSPKNSETRRNEAGRVESGVGFLAGSSAGMLMRQVYDEAEAK